MTRNYFSDVNMEASQSRQRGSHVPASILTAAEILESHEAALEQRILTSPPLSPSDKTSLTTLEVIGNRSNLAAQRLAANLAALELRTGSDNTNLTPEARARKCIEALSVPPPVRQIIPSKGGTSRQPPEPGIRSYSKAAFEAHPSKAKHRHPPAVISSVFAHGDGKYDDIHSQIITAVIQSHPGGRLIPLEISNLDVYGFCFTGHAVLEMVTSVIEGTGISTFFYGAPAKRVSMSKGAMGQQPGFEAGIITYKGARWTVYFATWVKGYEYFRRAYIVHEGDAGDDALVEDFILECGSWTSTPKEQIWVFDQGYWELDGALYAGVMQATWADIILPEDFKNDVLNDVMGFFDAEDTYRGLKMPWKRGIVFYGPPGNGKTITLKAIMKNLYAANSDIPTLPLPSLYVKSLVSWMPPEYCIRAVFQKARAEAPCFLIWEDLDSIIDDSNRSFFLNELDGLENNDGILVIGTTNHLDRLDPGIIKRPSRFDRKYLFGNPADEERKRYVQYWQQKLKDTPIDFTEQLVNDLAGMMKDFSFAYMKEAFVSTLLTLAGRRNNKDGGDEWAKKFEETIKKQIKTLREQLDAE